MEALDAHQTDAQLPMGLAHPCISPQYLGTFIGNSYASRPCGFIERDPIIAQLVAHPAALCVSEYAYAFGSGWLGRKFRTSRRRRLWNLGGCPKCSASAKTCTDISTAGTM